MSLAVLADHMASKGRNGDTMLVHMTPGEVRGLQALALAHGGSLSINPETGLPEASFLKSLLPMIAGMALNAFLPGVGTAIGSALGGLSGAVGTGILVGGVTGLATGSLRQGIMAGLGAYGGANLASGIAGLNVGAEQAAAMQGLTQDQIAGRIAESGGTLTQQGVLNEAAAQAAKKAIAAPMSEQLLGGAKAFAAAPVEGLKALARPAMMAAAPVIADAMVPTATKAPTVKPGDTGYIRQKVFDPFSQTYTDLAPVAASEWGSRTFAQNRGFNTGGIVALAEGGDLTKAQLGAQAIPYAQGTAATAKDIADIYQSVLGRAPDEGGLQFYQASQFSPEQIRADILKSPEAQAFMASQNTQAASTQAPLTHAQLGAQAIPYAQGVAATEADINQIYRDMLGRAPDEGGFQFYQASRFSPEQIRAEIAKSQEYLTRPFTPEAPTMDEVRSDYEAGGGGTQMRSINTPEPGARVMTQNRVVDTLQGYLAANPYATMEQIQAWGTANGIPAAQLAAAINERRFSQMTGGSLQAYDYLMGRGAYPITPFTRTGEIMRPYGEAVLGMPAPASSTRKYIFDPTTRKYILNPDYVPPQTSTGGGTGGGTTGGGTTGGTTGGGQVQWSNQATGETVTSTRDDPRYKNNPSWSIIQELAPGGLADVAAAGAAQGGDVHRYNLGGYSDGGRLLRGPGDGVSDSIPATIGGKQPARLADGEFVVPARIVSEIGNGSTEAGARKLYKMMDRVQRARAKTTGKGRVAKDTGAEKYLPA